MIKVYFESANGSFCEEIATFKDEECFDVCYPQLEKLAKKSNLILTEKILEEISE
jgi:hypothetical protein